MLQKAVLSAAFALLGSVTLLGTVIVPTTLHELAADAALIIRGHITDVRVMAMANRRVESVATVVVDRVIKGDAGPFVSVLVPGGLIGRYRYVMVGAPTLSPNEHAVFFLARGADNAWRPIGLSAGVVRILTEASTGRLVVHPPLFVGRTASVGPVVRGDAQRRRLAVGDFESMVQLVIADGPRPAAGEVR